MDIIIQFLIEHSEKFGAAGVFIGIVGLYFAKKFLTLSKTQAIRIKGLVDYNNALEVDYRKYIKESLPPGAIADNMKKSAETQGELLKELQHMHRDLHSMRLVKKPDGSIYLTPDERVSHSPHSHDHEAD